MTDIVSIDVESCALILIDMQTAIMQAMDPSRKEQLLSKTLQLLQAAGEMALPMICTEQNPLKLGATMPELCEHLSKAPLIAKMHFDACFESAFTEHLDMLAEKKVRSLIVAGIETHVCVLMTAMSLRLRGFSVFVPYDCVCSRKGGDADQALLYMLQNGIHVLPLESLLFSLLRCAGSDTFRKVLRVIR